VSTQLKPSAFSDDFSECSENNISAAERVLKLFQNQFNDTEHVGKYVCAAIIL